MKPQSEPHLKPTFWTPFPEQPEVVPAPELGIPYPRWMDRIASVVLMSALVGFAVAVCVPGVGVDGIGWLEGGLWIVVLLTSFVKGLGRFHTWAQGKDGAMDERERELRDRAYRWAYRIVNAAAMVVFCAIMVVALILPEGLSLGAHVVLYIAFTVSVFISQLPRAVLAWIVPREVGDDKDAGTDTGIAPAAPAGAGP